MDELKVLIQYVMLRKFNNNKNTSETAGKFLVFMSKVSLLTTKSENGFQSFILTIQHRDENLDQDAHKTSIKMI